MDNHINKKILVVEDDSNIAFNIRVHLDTAGYKVIVTNNGKKALEAISRDISLIILISGFLSLMVSNFAVKSGKMSNTSLYRF